MLYQIWIRAVEVEIQSLGHPICNDGSGARIQSKCVSILCGSAIPAVVERTTQSRMMLPTAGDLQGGRPLSKTEAFDSQPRSPADLRLCSSRQSETAFFVTAIFDRQFNSNINRIFPCFIIVLDSIGALLAGGEENRKV